MVFTVLLTIFSEVKGFAANQNNVAPAASDVKNDNSVGKGPDQESTNQMIVLCRTNQSLHVLVIG